MTSKIRTLLTVAAIAALMSASAVAQDGFVARATVPFDFMVGNQRVPAGEYEFARGPVWLKIISRESTLALFVPYQRVSTTRTEFPSELVFHQYGKQHFLREIWPGSSGAGARLGVSRSEKEQLARVPIRTTVAASIAR